MQKLRLAMTHFVNINASFLTRQYDLSFVIFASITV